MDKTNIMIEFNIVADYFDTDLLTKTIGIKPDEYWNKGDPISGRDHTQVETNWGISTGYTESLDVNEEMEKLISRLKSKVKELITFKDKYHVDYVFCAVINIKNNQSPAIYLTEKVINFLSLISAFFAIDLYIYS